MKKIYKGFTMIELIAALAIIGAVSGLGAARYLDFNERQVLQQAALNIKSDIRLAQHRALSGEKDVARCGPTQQLHGWCFSPDTGTVDYRVYGVCGSGLTRFPDPEPGYALPPEITLLTASYDGTAWADGGGKMLFQPLGQGIRFASDTIVAIRYCLTGNIPSLGTRNVYRIRITKSGEIIDEGIQTSCY